MCFNSRYCCVSESTLRSAAILFWFLWRFLDSQTTLLLHRPVFDTKNRARLWWEYKYWLLQDSFTAAWGWRGADLLCCQACSPHLLWLAVLFTPTPVGNVRMGNRLARDAQGSQTHTNSKYTFTPTHILLRFIFSAGFLRVWQGLLSWWELGAMPTVCLTRAWISTLTHTPTKQATRPHWHIQYFTT